MQLLSALAEYAPCAGPLAGVPLACTGTVVCAMQVACHVRRVCHVGDEQQLLQHGSLPVVPWTCSRPANQLLASQLCCDCSSQVALHWRGFVGFVVRWADSTHVCKPACAGSCDYNIND